MVGSLSCYKIGNIGSNEGVNFDFKLLTPIIEIKDTLDEDDNGLWVTSRISSTEIDSGFSTINLINLIGFKLLRL